MLEELLKGWKSDFLHPVLLAPAGSQIHGVALELRIEWRDLPVRKDGLHFFDNLKAVQRAVAVDIPPCDAVFAWTIRGFPSADWLGQRWQVPAAGVLHDSPFARKIHGPVLWDMRGLRLRKWHDWREMLWCSREYILRTWWRWQWAKRAADRFARLVCVSEAVRRDCVKKGYRCKLSVIRNGIADIAIPEKLPEVQLRIGFLGMEYPQRKGFCIIEQWISRLQGNVVWKLYGNASKSTLKRIGIRGRKSEIENQQSAISDQEANPMPHAPCSKHFSSVEYRGFQDRETIFREIDVLVHASTLFDPLPTVLIEASRAGIPCIASSNGGAAEIIEDGVSGFIFDPANPDEGFEKLKKLLDPAVRKKMGCNARRIFEQRFRVGQMAGEYRRLLAELAGL